MTAFFNRVIAIALTTTALSSGAMAGTLLQGDESSQPATAAPLPSETLPERAAPPVNRAPNVQPQDIEGSPTALPTTIPTPNPDVTPSDSPPYPTSNQPLISSPRTAPTVGVSKPAPAYKISVDGRVESTPNASFSLVVEKGDTVNIIAEHLQTPAKEIVKLNHLKKPYDLELGQKLKIPTEKVYVVQSGDTLYSISRRFTVKPAVLADVNDMDVGSHLRPGQKIALPIDHKDTGPIRTLIASRAEEPPTRPARRPFTQSPSAENGGDIGGAATPPARYTYARPSPSTAAPPSRYSLPPTINGAPQVDAAPLRRRLRSPPRVVVGSLGRCGEKSFRASVRSRAVNGTTAWISGDRRASR